MGNFRNSMARFMYGRYGVDQLYYAIFTVTIVLFILNLFFHLFPLNIAIWVLFILMIFRALSKNIYKRRAENEKFMKVWKKVSPRFKLQINRIKEIKTHRYRKCPHCKTTLRLPNKKGKHTVSCPKCNQSFSVNIKF